MAKEFDIYLRRRLTECDLLVYSIPYRDGISVTSRLVLETLLSGYILYKFAAAQTGTEMNAHINQMMKLCLEKLSLGTELSVSASFESQAKLYLENTPVVIDTPTIDTLEQVLNEMESKLVLAAEPLAIQAASSTGRGDFPLRRDAYHHGFGGCEGRAVLRLPCLPVLL